MNQPESKTTRTQPKKKHIRKPAERMELVRFVALAHPERMEEFGFTTLGEFAKRFKVNPGTLSEWLKEPEIQEQIKATWKRWGKERTPDVIMSLYKKAITEGNAAEAMTWMKIIEDWTEETHHKHSGEIKGSEQPKIIIIRPNKDERVQSFLKKIRGEA
jgi:hypothetical protein